MFNHIKQVLLDGVQELLIKLVSRAVVHKLLWCLDDFPLVFQRSGPCPLGLPEDVLSRWVQVNVLCVWVGDRDIGAIISLN